MILGLVQLSNRVLGPGFRLASGDMMRRIQFIELHDQAWFPPSLREEVIDALQFGLGLLKPYGSVAILLRRAFDFTRCQLIVDMCSGGGGPWPYLSRRVGGPAQVIHVCLTDKYPNLGAFQKLQAASQDRITFRPESVDATNVPGELKGFRTMFTAFHHFSPVQARAILQNAVDDGQNIGVFEMTKRAPWTIALMIPWALMPLFFTPWIRPFRWSRLFWTYVVPVVPFVFLFDGAVSCLRTYRPEEMRAMVQTLTENGYRWEIGEQSGAAGEMAITYLIGCAPARP
jgi:hypothetical protein